MPKLLEIDETRGAKPHILGEELTAGSLSGAVRGGDVQKPRKETSSTGDVE